MATRRQARPQAQTGGHFANYAVIFAVVGGLVILIVLMASGGGKSEEAAVAPVAPATPAPEPEAKPAPSAEVPKDFIARVEAAWPGIEAQGEEFEKLFEEAKVALNAGDRKKFADLNDKASKVFKDLNEEWAEIYYSVDDLPERTAEACRRWLGGYARKMKVWEREAKSLKERSITTGN